jgi:hypothetical protein
MVRHVDVIPDSLNLDGLYSTWRVQRQATELCNY